MTIGPGQSYAASATIRVPGDTASTHYCAVQTNSAGDIFEGQNTANNTLVSSAPTALDVPALPTDGSAVSGQFAAIGEEHWFEFTPQAGQDILVTLNMADTGGAAQLFIGQGYMPSPQHYDETESQWNSAEVTALAASTSTETYYILAEPSSLSGVTNDFTIQAAALDFQLKSASPSTVGNTGSTTLALHGGELTKDMTYQVVDPSGIAHDGNSVFVVNSSLVYATFDLNGLSPGAYGVQVVDGSRTAALPGGLTVVSAPAGQVQASISGPAHFRPGRVVTLEVDYVNTGSTDVSAPILFLQSDNGQFRLPGQTAWVPDAFQLLAIDQSGPAGVLPPGYHGSMQVEFLPKTLGAGIQSTFGVSLADPAALVDWAGLKSSLQPRFQPQDSWDVIYQNFLAKVGTTYGQLQQVLAADATYLSGLGEYARDVRRLLSFEFEQADDFGAITQRHELGAFGIGIPDPTELSATTDADGDVVIRCDGKIRFFSRQADGSYEGLPGDNGTLSLVGSDYQLRETNGFLTVFRSDGKLDYTQDSDGNRTTADYMGSLLTGFTDSAGDTTSYTYDANGRITLVTDPVGRVTTYTYDASDEHLLKVSSASGAMSFTWVTGQGPAEENALQSVTYPDGTHTYYAYDAEGRLTRQSRDGGAMPVAYSYDAFGGMTATDAAACATSVQPNEFCQLATIEDAQGNTATATYDANHKLVSQHSSSGLTTTFSYDSSGNPISIVGPSGQQISATYDPASNEATSIVDAAGNAVSLQYDSQGNLQTALYANSTSDQYQYDAAGNITELTNTQGQPFHFTYNAQNLLVSEEFPDGTSATFSYDSHRNVASMTDPSGTTTYNYDAADRLTAVSYAGGQSLAITYDAAGQCTQVVNQDGVAVNYAYDSLGRLSRLSDETGLTLDAYHYDAAGRLASEDLSNGTISTYSYTSAGLLASVVNQAADGSILARSDYAYDDQGRMTSVGTLAGTFTYAYDALGRVASSTTPDGQFTYQYDAAGNLVSWAQSQGNTVRCTYNANGLLVRKDLPDGTYQTFTYDAHWNLASMTDATGTTAFTHNAAGWLTGVSYPDGESLTFTYDADGRRTSMATQDGFTVNYAYNSQGQLARISNAAGQTITAYTYDAAGRIIRTDQGNGAYTTCSYLPKNLLQSVVNKAPDGSVLSQFEYTYDALGRPVTMTTLDGTTTYGYDLLGQLTSVDEPGGQTIAYQYDAAGNRVSEVDSGTTTSYATNDLNQCTASGPATYQYDAAGNLISKTDATGTTSYAYNGENQLVSVVSPADTWTYQYNALGQQVSSTHNGRQTDYLIDPTGLGNMIGAYQASGSGSGQAIAHYAYGYGLTSCTDASGSADYYAFDGSGNTVDLTGPTGAALDTYSYLPFGETLSATGSVNNPFTYGGQSGAVDESNGLYFMRNRWYDPVLGRFTQPDPLGLSGGDPNLYRYAGNSPIVQSDPSGTTSSPLNPALLPVGMRSLGSFQSSVWDPNAVNATPQVVQHVLQQLSPDLSQVGSVVFSQMQIVTSQIMNHVNANGLEELAGTELGAVVANYVNSPGIIFAGTTDVPTFYATWATVLGGGHVDFEQALTYFQEQWAATGGTNVTVLFTQLDTNYSGEIPWFMFPLVSGDSQATAMWNMSGAMWDYLEQQTQSPAAGSSEDWLNGTAPETSEGSIEEWLSGTGLEPTQSLFKPSQDSLDMIASSQEFPGLELAALAPGEGGNPFTAAGVGFQDPSSGNAFDIPPAPSGGGEGSGEGGGLPGGGVGGNSGSGEQVASVDPNDMVGPTGFGSEGFVQSRQTLPYTIQFENQAAATAPAQVVTITQTLDSSLDLSTFALGEMGFGSQVVHVPAGCQAYSTRVDDRATSGLYVDLSASLNPATRVVTWTFTSIDPVTNKPPQDPLAGFLPPDQNSPQGEGWVTYTVQSQTTATTGTQIHAQAAVVFDQNAPLTTPAVLNTIDAGPPSSVAALPATEPATSFPVSWSGQDDAGGSGIASYSIYVSEDGGVFQPWLTGTTDTSATYNGQLGHTYGFYSIATDNVGNQEAAKTTADASTAVSLPVTQTWLGGGTDNLWSDGSNWSSLAAPNPGDNLVFQGTVQTTTKNDLPVGMSLESITIGSAGFLLGGKAVTLASVSTPVVTLAAASGTIQLPITLGSDGTFAVSDLQGSLVDSGDIDNGGYNLTVDTSSSQASTLSGSISGTGGLIKTGSGNVVLSGTNSFSGGTQVLAGTLAVISGTALPAGSSLTVDAGGIFIFDPSQSASSASAAGLAMPVPRTAAASEIPTPVNAAIVPAKEPTTTSAPSATTANWAGLQLSAVAVPSSKHFRTDVLPTPAPMLSVANDAVFKSHRSVFDQTVLPADNAQSAPPWAWLAAIESSWNTSDQNKTSGSTVEALDMVLARFGL